MVKILQIFYDDSQKQYLSPLVAHYDNSGATNQPCLENHVIAKSVASGFHGNCTHYGVLSWAFERKRALKIDTVLELVKNDNYATDVYAFDSMHTKPNVWIKAEQWHKGICGIAKEAFEHAGLKEYAKQFDKIITPNIYSNAFLARPVIYEAYVHTVLIPFMNVLVEMESAQADAKYKVGKATPEHLLKSTGYNYYTMMPFVCERLFATFMGMNSKLKLKHLV